VYRRARPSHVEEFHSWVQNVYCGTAHTRRSVSIVEAKASSLRQGIDASCFCAEINTHYVCSAHATFACLLLQLLGSCFPSQICRYSILSQRKEKLFGCSTCGFDGVRLPFYTTECLKEAKGDRKIELGICGRSVLGHQTYCSDTRAVAMSWQSRSPVI
jgi:hypothetical protein